MASLDGINGLSIQTLLRGENDSKQSDEFQANFGGDSHSHWPLVKQRQQNSQKRRLRKAEIVSVSVLSKVLSLDKLSCPQIWNIEQEKGRQKEKVGDRPAKLNEKKGDRDLEQRDKKQRRYFLAGRPTW